LGSQGALTLTQDHSFLLAVNAGSGDVSVFRVHGAMLSLADRVPCGGSEPVAIAQHGDLVYVVNAGGSNITGFRLDKNGRLKPIADSIAFLTTGNSGAASLSCSPDGQFLLVTEKITNNIDGFHIQIDGTLGPIVVNPSVGPGAFAVLFAPNGTALVTETGPTGGHTAAISSYAVLPNVTLSAISQRAHSGRSLMLASRVSGCTVRLHLEHRVVHDFRIFPCCQWRVDSFAGDGRGDSSDGKYQP
jgi:6-phosphogluconolactonase